MDGSYTASGEYRDKGKHKIPIKLVDKDDKLKRVNFAVDDSFNLDTTSSETVVNAGTI
jgi:hypothetical protein